MTKGYRVITLTLLLVGLLAGCAPATPTPAPADLGPARAAMTAGDYTQAVTLLETIVAANDTDAEAYFMLGLSYFNLQQYDPARAAFQRSLELDDSRAAAVHHNLGALAYQRNDYETATTEFTAALAADPNDPDTHYQLGATYLILSIPEDSFFPDQEKLTQAQTEFETALTLQPGKPEALVGLGNVYLLQNRIDDAITLLKQAADENPQMLEALFGLGRAYAIAGDNAAARETLEAFLALNPPAIWADQANEILNSLEP